MQEKHLFEYAIIRVVPRVEREEFLNVGVVLYCRDKRYLQIRYIIDEPRILALCSHIDLADIREHLQSFEKISIGAPGSGTIGSLDIASRFRWLIATRSTVVQTSKVHPGLCDDPGEMLDRLHQQMVL